MTGEGKEKQNEISKIKYIGFVNYKWTEILVEDDEECNSIDPDEVKMAIIQMMKREENNPLDNWTDKFIRVNQKTYVPVEVAKDRNGRMIYSPIIPTAKPKISFGVEIRTPSESDTEDREQQPGLNEITEVEYPQARRICKRTQDPNIKINADVEIINKVARNNNKCNKQHQTYRSCLTKKELLNLINEEINLDEDQSINLVEIINRASLTEHPNTTNERTKTIGKKEPKKFAPNLNEPALRSSQKDSQSAVKLILRAMK